MAVYLAISEIFSVKEWPDLQIWVWGRSRSLKIALFDRQADLLYHYRASVYMLTRDNNTGMAALRHASNNENMNKPSKQ